MGSTTRHCSVCEYVVFLVILRILIEYLNRISHLSGEFHFL